MVDLIYGRGVTDIIREMPYYIHDIQEYDKYKIISFQTCNIWICRCQ